MSKSGSSIDEHVGQIFIDIYTELTEEKARHAKAELEAAEENKRLLDSIDEAHKRGARERAENLADNALGKTLTCYWITAIAFIAVVIYCAMVCIEKFANEQWTWLPEVYEKAPAIIDALITIAVGVVGFLVYKKLLCELDRDKIRERLINKYSK